MKYIKIIISIIIIASVSILTHCGDDDDPTPQEQMTNKLINGNKAWTAQGGSVTVDGSAAPDDWSSFKISFSDGAYTTSGSPVSEIWSSSGTWDYANETTTSQIVRGDNTTIDINISNNTLTMSFTAPWGVGSRTKSVGGEYQFTLKSE